MSEKKTLYKFSNFSSNILEMFGHLVPEWINSPKSGARALARATFSGKFPENLPGGQRAAGGAPLPGKREARRSRAARWVGKLIHSALYPVFTAFSTYLKLKVDMDAGILRNIGLVFNVRKRVLW